MYGKVISPYFFQSLWRPNRRSVQGYFLAGRSMQWFPVSLSLGGLVVSSKEYVLNPEFV